MTHTFIPRIQSNLARRAVVAGLAGGVAEMLWISLYASVSTTRSAVVASEIGRTVIPTMENPTLLTVLGVSIHVFLSIALAAVFAWVVVKPFFSQRRGAALLASAIAVLMVIWVTNFFVILPIVNPVFVTLLPYSVTLASKLMFGIAMAFMFSYLNSEQAVRRVSASG